MAVELTGAWAACAVAGVVGAAGDVGVARGAARGAAMGATGGAAAGAGTLAAEAEAAGGGSPAARTGTTAGSRAAARTAENDSARISDARVVGLFARHFIWGLPHRHFCAVAWLGTP